MCRAVTLSRSPPRAETTMIAAGERSRFWRHSSKASASGSIRSRSTMSGSSVSSNWRARMPSTDTMVSNPRTARLDRIRSTMLGSSSTTRAQVLRASSVVVTVAVPLARGGLASGGRASARARHRRGYPARVALGLDRKVNLEAGALGQRGQLDPAAVGLHDPLGDGQAETRAFALAVAVAVALAVARDGAGAGAAGGFERGGRQFRRHADAVVQDADHHFGHPVVGGHAYPGARRVVAERVVQQVDEDLLHT